MMSRIERRGDRIASTKQNMISYDKLWKACLAQRWYWESGVKGRDKERTQEDIVHQFN